MFEVDVEGAVQAMRECREFVRGEYLGGGWHYPFHGEPEYIIQYKGERIASYSEGEAEFSFNEYPNPEEAHFVKWSKIVFDNLGEDHYA